MIVVGWYYHVFPVRLHTSIFNQKVRLFRVQYGHVNNVVRGIINDLFSIDSRLSATYFAGDGGFWIDDICIDATSVDAAYGRRTVISPQSKVKQSKRQRLSPFDFNDPCTVKSDSRILRDHIRQVAARCFYFWSISATNCIICCIN